MMRKLLKHEFIATGRIMGIVYAIVALAIAYIEISYLISSNGEPTILQALSSFLALVVSFLNIYFTVIVLIVNFQKSLYSDQGYLSYTLPVKGVTLLASKLIVSIVWIVASGVCLFGSFALIINAFEDYFSEEKRELIEMCIQLIMPGADFHVIAARIAAIIISALIILFVFVMALYFCITLSNTRKFQKHHTLWTILLICVITVISIKIISGVSEAVDLCMIFDLHSISIGTSWDALSESAKTVSIVPVGVSLIMGVGFFFGTFTLMSKKVNIA